LEQRAAEQIVDPVRRAATVWLRRDVPDLLAVIGHGAAERGEDVPGAPLELLAVVRVPPAEAVVERACHWVGQLFAPERCELTFIESHRLGWLPPSLLQQSLLWGGTLLWGDPAALRVIPSWRPDMLDPRLSLDLLATAEEDQRAGHHLPAVHNAAGALLLARRAYRHRFDARAEALRSAWPEAPVLPVAPKAKEAAAFVARARHLIDDWLFTWEGEGPGESAIARYRAMWRAAALVRGG
jgi:hypothetical protein